MNLFTQGYIVGFITAAFALTIIDAFNTIVTTIAGSCAELFKYKISVKIAKYNAEINKISEEQDIKPPAIGFAIPADEDYDFEDDDDE